MYKKDLVKWVDKKIAICTREYQNAVQVLDNGKVDKEGDRMVTLLEFKEQVEKLEEMHPCIAS